MAIPRAAIDFGYRLMDAGRSRKAAEAARQPPATGDFSSLRGSRQALVVTFKRSGEPVPTPVNHGVSDDGRVYFRAEPIAWKVRRLRNDPRVLIAPCNLRGRPRGPLVEGRARVVSPGETERAHAVVAGNWSAAMRPLEAALDRVGIEMAYVEVVPASEGAGNGGDASRDEADASRDEADASRDEADASRDEADASRDEADASRDEAPVDA